MNSNNPSVFLKSRPRHVPQPARANEPGSEQRFAGELVLVTIQSMHITPSGELAVVEAGLGGIVAKVCNIVQVALGIAVMVGGYKLARVHSFVAK